MTAAPMAPVAAKLDETAELDLQDKASDDGESDPGSAPSPDRPRTQRALPKPNRKISPFKLHFSQMRARHEFRDKKLLEDSVPLIEFVLCEGTPAEDGPVWRLEAPFPPIEVLQWRCKLRDETTGRPKLDPDTGEELWDTSDRMFTLDNRRLYCLQKASVAKWPDKVLVEVVELPNGPLTRIRELKKFRTLDVGRSIFIGGRQDGESLVKWCWREACGLPPIADGEESDDVGGDEPAAAESSTVDNNRWNPDRVQLRQRKRYTSGGRGMDGRTGGRGAGGSQGRGNGNGWSKRNGANSEGDEEETEGRSSMSWGSLVVFIGLYCALRFFTKLVTAMTKTDSSRTDTVEAADGSTHMVTAIATGGTAALLAAMLVHVVSARLGWR